MLNIDIGKLLADPEVTFEAMLSALTASHNVPTYSESQIRAIAWHLESLNFSLRFSKARLRKETSRESAFERLDSSVKDNYFLTFDNAGMTPEQLSLANSFITSIMTQEVSDLKIDFMALDDNVPLLTEVVTGSANEIMTQSVEIQTKTIKSDGGIPVLTETADSTNGDMIQSVEIQPETIENNGDYPVLTEVVTDPLQMKNIIQQSSRIQRSVKKLSGDALDIFLSDVLKPIYYKNIAELVARKNGKTVIPQLSQIGQEDLLIHANFIRGQLKIAHQKMESALKTENPVQDVNVIPDAVTSRPQQKVTKPQESRLTSWFRERCASSVDYIKRAATATAIFFGGGAAVSLAAAFAISTQSPPEAPKEPETFRITFAAAADTVAAQANVEPPPPVAVAAAAPVAKIAKPVLAKPAPSAKQSFAPDNYIFIPATIGGVQLQKMSSDTIDRMCKSDIQTWVCPKTPENI